MWVLQYSTWTIVTHPSYAFWGTALVTILADWMELHVLVILFLSFNRLLPSWQTFVIFSAERPASHQHARLTHFCVFTDKRSLHMHSLQLPSMKKIFFLDPDLTSAVAEEGRLLARAMLWVRWVYVSFQLLRTPCTLTSHRVHCNWTHPALYFELWQSSLRPDSLPFQTYRFLWRSDGRWRQAKQTNKNLLNKSSHLPQIQNLKMLVITWLMTHLLSMSSLSASSSACIIFQLLNKKSLLNYHHLGISLLLQQIMHRWIGPLPLQGFHPPPHQNTWLSWSRSHLAIIICIMMIPLTEKARRVGDMKELEKLKLLSR